MNWNSLDAMFSAINKRVSYVIIRNYENIDDIVTSEHPDIDILCENSHDLIQILNSTSRSGNKKDFVHQQIYVADRAIPIDVREVGDGYFDPLWAKDVLKNRELHDGRFYVMDEENYFYTLLYHCLIQKDSISIDYKRKLEYISSLLNIPYVEAHAMDMLESFMRRNSYKYTYPSKYTKFRIEKADKKLVEHNAYKRFVRNILEIKLFLIRTLKHGRVN